MECFLQSSTNFPDRLGRPKERKEKTKPQQELFSTFHQPEAGSKLCRAGTLQTTAHTQEKNKAPEPLSPGIWGISEPESSSKPEVSSRASAPTPSQHSTSQAAAEQRREQQLQETRNACDCTAFVHLVYQQALPGPSLRKGEQAPR